MNGMTYIERNGVKLAITHLPNRKHPCLIVQIDNCQYKVASFNDETTAQWFAEIVEEMLGEKE